MHQHQSDKTQYEYEEDEDSEKSEDELEENSEEDPETQKAHIEDQQDTLDLVATLTNNDHLESTKAEADNLEPETVTITLGRILGSLTSLLFPSIHSGTGQPPVPDDITVPTKYEVVDGNQPADSILANTPLRRLKP